MLAHLYCGFTGAINNNRVVKQNDRLSVIIIVSFNQRNMIPSLKNGLLISSNYRLLIILYVEEVNGII